MRSTALVLTDTAWQILENATRVFQANARVCLCMKAAEHIHSEGNFGWKFSEHRLCKTNYEYYVFG